MIGGKIMNALTMLMEFVQFFVDLFMSFFSGLGEVFSM